MLEEIKAEKPKLPIIMLSSRPKVQYGEIALSKGAADYFEKFNTAKLVEVIRRVTILQ
jgi:FixJ family two-component response regulator